MAIFGKHSLPHKSPCLFTWYRSFLCVYNYDLINISNFPCRDSACLARFTTQYIICSITIVNDGFLLNVFLVACDVKNATAFESSHLAKLPTPKIIYLKLF